MGIMESSHYLSSEVCSYCLFNNEPFTLYVSLKQLESRFKWSFPLLNMSFPLIFLKLVAHMKVLGERHQLRGHGRCCLYHPDFSINPQPPGPWLLAVLSAGSSWLRVSSGVTLAQRRLPCPRLPAFLRDNPHLMPGLQVGTKPSTLAPIWEQFSNFWKAIQLQTSL